MKRDTGDYFFKSNDNPNAISDIPSLERCPNCLQVPLPIFHDNGSVHFECAEHGHIGLIGESYKLAIEYWNLYILFLRTDIRMIL